MDVPLCCLLSLSLSFFQYIGEFSGQSVCIGVIYMQSLVAKILTTAGNYFAQLSQLAGHHCVAGCSLIGKSLG